MADNNDANKDVKDDDDNMKIDKDEKEDLRKINQTEKEEEKREEIFDSWIQSCLNSSSSKEELHSISFHYFSPLQRERSDKKKLGGTIALLLSKLGPPLSKPQSIYKIKSLTLLHGALEGLAAATHNGATGELSCKLVELVGNFLLSYIGPLDMAEGEEDIRDVSIRCIDALLSIPPAVENTSKEESKEEWVNLQLRLGKTAVQRRCALEGDDDYDNKDEEEVGDGLSSLSRLRRSYCFDALLSTIQSIQQLNISSDESLQKATKQKMKEFSSYTISCLYNETDPRCLLQMLKLLCSLQKTCSPLFDSGSDDIKFPHTELFDAIAPYYPIQFTPPPNDIHGITKEGLQEAHLACFSYPDKEMRDLSIRLFLDRVSPPVKQQRTYYDEEEEEEEEPSVEDKLEALEDMADLFGIQFNKQAEAKQKTKSVNDSSKQLSLLTPELLRDLSDGLIRIHQQSIQILSSPSTDKEEERCYKDLAKKIRSFSSVLSLQLEQYHPKEQPTEKSSNCNDATTKTTHENAYKLWDAYVLHSIQSLSISISSSPQTLHGRASTVFLSSLSAGGGGERTLRSVLNSCIPPLLGYLQEYQSSSEGGDEEKVTATCFALGAFFSSVSAASERKMKGLDNGNDDSTTNMNYVVMHPHPLRDYGIEAITLLVSFLDVETKTEDNEEEKVPYSVKISATRALESVLLSTPSSILFHQADEEENQKNRDTIFTTLLHLTDAIILNYGDKEEEDDGTIEKEWKKACAKTIGSLMGRSSGKIEQKEEISLSDATTCVMDDNPSVIQYMLTQVLLPILKSSIATTTDGPLNVTMTHDRYDRMALANACTNGNNVVSNIVISSIVKELMKALRVENNNESKRTEIHRHPAIAPAMTLSYMFQKGGHHTHEAFHDSSSFKGFGNDGDVSFTPMDIIKALCNPPSKKKKLKEESRSDQDGGKIVLGMSRLMLPETKEQNRVEVQGLIDLSHAILPHILPAYQGATPPSEIESIVQFVSQVIPPLTEWDELKLCTALPLLATALNQRGSATAVANNTAASSSSITAATKELLKEMITCLVEYAMSGDYRAEARAAAASIVFSTLLYYQDGSTRNCLGRVLLRDVISPAIVQSANMMIQSLLEEETKEKILTRSIESNESPNMDKRDELRSYVDTFECTMNILSLVGSAAACRGGQSSQTSDLVMRFLIQLTCTGTALSPETNEKVFIGKITPAFNSLAESLSVIAGLSFGAVLSVENGGAFWRQRVSHIAIPEVLLACNKYDQNGQDDVSSTFVNFPLGPLAAGCHIICCVPVSALGEQKVNDLLGVIVRGLICCANRMPYLSKNQSSHFGYSNIYTLTSLVFASILKLMAIAPNVVAQFTSSLVPYTLLICESFRTKKSSSCHIMALQCLINIPGLPNSRKVCIAYRMPVLSYTAEALDSCSYEVRQTAVQVRNTWCILE